jgi:hypothetical protein
MPGLSARVAWCSLPVTPMRRSNFSVWRRAVDSTPQGPGSQGLGWPVRCFTSSDTRQRPSRSLGGPHPVAIRERMGHSSIVVTMDTYGGLIPRLDEAIAEGLDAPLRDALAAWPRADGAPTAHRCRSASDSIQPSKLATRVRFPSPALLVPTRRHVVTEVSGGSEPRSP